MRVLSEDNDIFFSPVHSFVGGTPVRFAATFHERQRVDDVFIINDVTLSCRPENRSYRGKVGVTNLRTGRLAYIDADRSCVMVECHVRRGAPDE